MRSHVDVVKEVIKYCPKDLDYVSFEFLCANEAFIEFAMTILDMSFKTKLTTKVLAAKNYREKKQALLLGIKLNKIVSVIKKYDAKLADLDATVDELRHYQASNKLSDFCKLLVVFI